MEKTRRIIALVLAMLMLCSLGVTAFAGEAQEQEKPKYQHYDSVFAIGDSNTMGYGLNGYKGNIGNGRYVNREAYLNFVEGSYPDCVADALGVPVENRNNMSYPAFRAKDALFYLGGNVDMTEDDYYNDNYIGWYNVVDEDSGAEANHDYTFGSNFIDQIKYKDGDKKLVLLYGGSADVFFTTSTEVMKNGFDTSDIGASAKDIVTLLVKGYQYFLEYVPALIERIKTLNPAADIVLVGAFNPAKDLKLTEDSELHLLDAIATITALMNQQYQLWAKMYNCKFADIGNVETRTLEMGLTVAAMFDTDPEKIYHATPEGYKYIARQILNELTVEKAPVTTNIVVDLGATKKVEAVTVNGIIMTNFSYNKETYELTVPYLTTEANLLTVSVKNDDGTTALYTYQLSFGAEGYTAYRMYATHDLAQTLKNIINKVIEFFRSLVASIFGTAEKA